MDKICGMIIEIVGEGVYDGAKFFLKKGIRKESISTYCYGSEI